MYTITYKDDYGTNRHQDFDTYDELMIAFSSCVTLPDHLAVISLTLDGRDLGYHGLVGDFYPFLQSLAPKR